jgi:ribosomal-protein-alanine N-acetyltransferase
VTAVGPELETERLRLRHWRDRERHAFVAMNADPEVMRYFPSTLERAVSEAWFDRLNATLDEEGFGLWAVARREDDAWLGMAGLAAPTFFAAFTPCVEVGWRFPVSSWGHGYATEAARAAVGFGFTSVGLEEILSWTTVDNQRSRAVMERLGMTHDPTDDFEHPRLPVGHPMRRHVLYRLRAPAPLAPG